MIKRILINLLFISGIAKLSESFNKNKVVVLAYHRVCPIDPKETLIKDMVVSPEAFDEQMQYVASNYNVVFLDELAGLLESDSLHGKHAVVTFDDAYSDNYEYALPILRKYGIPATIFVPTSYIDSEKSFFWDDVAALLCASKLKSLQFTFREKEYYFDLSRNMMSKVYGEIVAIFKKLDGNEIIDLKKKLQDKLGLDCESKSMTMSWIQMKEMKEYDITFGAHTHTHCVVASRNSDDIKREMIISMDILNRELSQQTTCFAFPFGSLKDVGENAAIIAEEVGYKCAVTMEQGLVCAGDNRFLLKRVGVGGNDNFKKFVLKVSGFIPFLSSVKERINGSYHNK
ncbi:MAG: hypothetical protein A2Y03_04920 [Omnitrophica WOR_2 bacterium GWF2_38_59]|nr:MAG: hypothetical protein A2Y03_04920 [Omnitrophica WOR_2 bacterium GWF2_38_59]OGX48274.1 MAG: hypothetical protein A2243_10370 [Omnitrophica WOR_2 bacterium RIFOXYA2_FULL_38_17]OGX59562.1 MAG: hypothetical protein A2447_11930 [Omnitrophica WOR_2 bacterium RIFOXYC2_FULL_38_12]OGX59953.1 MAG: hypothetical protein A2306_04465 [Omnitrophica WOR_2 bacterium RIFOXYB2_FULL_38_16]